MINNKILSREDVLSFLHTNKETIRIKFGFKDMYLFGSYARNKQEKIVI